MQRWNEIDPNKAALSGWQHVLEIEPRKGARGYIQASERILILVDELDILRDKLQLLGFSSNAYGPAFAKLDNALSPQHLLNPSGNIRQYLSEDVFAVLIFCSEVLPDEEDGIALEEFAEIVSIINDLELLLADNSFPSELKAVLRRHIRLAETALADYPLRGASAIKEAVKSATGDIFFSESEVSKLQPDQRNSLSALWRKMNAVADKVIKVDNIIQISGRAVTFLENFAKD